ncbi:hypothetical protein THAOC_36920 [Thalassiosira oceanica]|uniref:Uncharacterized protein n=1 Tax=Thalassiosira oceanica TaxID=159749 RepID=K0QZE6_THAOC|nr:hypothetical protein THAOC_36920 [Thalassiosira oceanica]|eukprot:EJK44530.1 hypothetical protein THAOC_36920 [Thalassiosira oceanica]
MPTAGDGSGDAVPSPTSGRAVAEHVRENDEHLDRVRSLIAEVDDLLGRNLGTSAAGEEGEATGPGPGRSGRAADAGWDDVPSSSIDFSIPSSLDLSDGGSPQPVPDGADEGDGGRSDGSDDGAIEIEFGSGGSTVSDLASSPSTDDSDESSDDSSDDEKRGQAWAGLGIGIDAPEAGPRRVEVDLDAPRLGGTGLDELRGRLGAWRSESAGELDRWNSMAVVAVRRALPVEFGVGAPRPRRRRGPRPARKGEFGFGI